MKVIIDIDDKYEETSINIKANKWTDELEELVSLLHKQEPKRLFGFEKEHTVLIDPTDVDFVYAENRKVFAAIKKRRPEIRMKLYEIEQALAPYHFMRFSKSVIGNLHHIQRFELSFNGNLCVHFHSGNKEYITRKYVSTIKEKLTIGGMNNDD